MEYTDYLVWKLVAIVALAFVYGFIRGINGLPLRRGPTEEAAPQEQARPADR